MVLLDSSLFSSRSPVPDRAPWWEDTVRMSDGRLKYLVDEGELGHVWAGDYRTGEVVTVRRGTQKFDARVAGHDDDEGTYTSESVQHWSK